MPIIDLLTPWAHASETHDGLDAFHHRHHQLLERVRRQRTPTSTGLATPSPTAGQLSTAHNPSVHAALRNTCDTMRDAGWRTPRDIVLLGGGEPGAPWEVLPDPDHSTVLLFVDRVEGDALTAALIAGIATWHRWSATSPSNVIARVAARDGWDKWDAMRHAPLAEWIYTEGIAMHAVAERFPEWNAGQLLSCTRTAHERLRQTERELRSELESELDQTGIGLVIKWLIEDAPPALRQRETGRAVPRGAGRYLAWRMLQHRVARVGVLDAAEPRA